MFWALNFLVLAPRAKVLSVGHNPFTPLEHVLHFGDSTFLWGHYIWSSILGGAVSLLLLSFSVHLFCILLCVYLLSRSFLEENYSKYICKFVVSLGESEFRALLYLLLESPQKLDVSEMITSL